MPDYFIRDAATMTDAAAWRWIDDREYRPISSKRISKTYKTCYVVDVFNQIYAGPMTNAAAWRWIDDRSRTSTRHSRNIQKRSRQRTINAMKPLPILTGTDTDIECIYLTDQFDDHGEILIGIGVQTKSGTRTTVLPLDTAAEFAEKLAWLCGRRACRPGDDARSSVT